jgi:DNA polymerase I
VLSAFREIVVADFEFAVTPGDRPVPLCLVAHELRSGRRFRVWKDQFGPAPPYATGPDVLFVAYYASAELGCYRALGWPTPARIVDLFVEFRQRTNGLRPPGGAILLGALAYFGLDAVGATAKGEMQKAIGGDTWQGRFTQTEILDYCESDVVALARLLPAIAPRIDLPRALLRGRYMAAAAAMEYCGAPIDAEMLARFRERWTDIQGSLIVEIDADYGVYEGRTFKAKRFEHWLVANNIPWPLLESGRLALDDTRSAKWPAPIRPCRPCGSCAVRCRSYASTISPSDGTAAIGQYCRPSGAEQGATNQVTPSIFLGLASGCAG